MVMVTVGDTCVVRELGQELSTALHLCNSVRGPVSFLWLQCSILANISPQGDTMLLLALDCPPLVSSPEKGRPVYIGCVQISH